MKLLLPDLMYHLERKDVLAIRGMMPDFVPAKDRRKRAFAARMIPLLHQAQKFIFDSGSDQDPRTTEAVRETAVAMLEGNLFHLPFPVLWIEDPFEDESIRNFYLCVETEKTIEVYLFQTMPPDPTSPVQLPAYVVTEFPLIIDLENPTDLFTVPVPVSDFVARNFAEAIYSVKKFIVSLNTEQLEREVVPGKRIDPTIDKRWRKYEHTIVRVPVDTAAASGEGTGTGRPRRRHLVRGHWRGTSKNYAERKWIKPYFRGNADLGEVQRDHYEVKARI